MNVDSVVAGIVTLAGSAGFAAAVTGFWAYKTEAAKGRRANGPDRNPRGQPLDPDDVREASGPAPGAHDIELLANAATTLAAAITKASVLLEFFVCNQLGDDEGTAFRKWLDKREMEEILAAHRAHAARPPP